MADTIYQKAARQVDGQLVEPLRTMLMARRLFAKQVPMPKGKYNMDYLKLTDMGAGNISYELPQGDLERDMVKLTGANIKLVHIWKGFMMERAAMDEFASQGVQLDATGAMGAARVVAEREEDLLMMGWKRDGTAYEVNGLYNGAGTTEATSSVTSTNGNAVIKLKLARAALKAAKVYGCNFNWVLATGNYEEVMASVNAYGVMEQDQVRKQLNTIPGQPQGDILEGPKLTADTGLLLPIDPLGLWYDLLLGQDPRTYFGYDSKLGEEISPVYGHTIECLIPRIKQPLALCKTTGL